MRTALLWTVSHDLRSPLAAATAAISGLRAQDIELAAADRDELLDTDETPGGGLTMIMSMPAAPRPARLAGPAWWPASPSPDRRELPDDNDRSYAS